MTTSLGFDKPVAASAAGDASDPFLASPSGPTHLRHSNFDTQLFALAPGSSAEQVKRAIEAHLRDTERRMEEAGKLGTALVQQQKQLTEKLREVEQLQSEAELSPELRQRLIEIEKDYNEVARESARALLPKQRVPSNEAQGSPFSPDKAASRRSVSPSKFESLAAPSPTKFGIPNRKIRNQPASRVHDIEFAAEISTSLIAQVRNLQALLSEREEELKEVKSERSRLEIEVEGFQQRLKSLDESESRYKDENWNLETQIHELIAAQKEAAEREKKLTQALNVIQAERNAAQRELEEVKDSLARQDEKHSAEIKNLEIELGTSRRSAVLFETERSALQRKVDELTGQNQELAKAFSALQRGRALDREAPHGGSEEDSNSAPDHNTPEHSPPPSPMKPTPRHSALESETLKTSLGHAQRTIQTLRTNIHREKTEKLELKRMLQDARDEIEKLRSDPHPQPKRIRKAELRESKKPSFKLNRLGVPRSSRTEVVEDPDWEDQSEGPSPRALSHRGSVLRLSGDAGAQRPLDSNSDQFETAHETSDAAFETAHERATETEDFQTGIEDMSDDDDDAATETEAGPSRGAHSIKRPPPLPPHQSSNQYSFDSTASTSSDEDDHPVGSEMKTPTAGPRIRMRVSRGSLGRRSRQFSEEPAVPSSPVSIPAHSTSAASGGQSLFAELNNVDNSDDDSCAGAATPGRRSIRSATPATPRSVVSRRHSPPPRVPALPRIMVDSGVMTEPVDIRPVSAITDGEDLPEDGVNSVSRPPSIVFPARPLSMESVIGPRGLGDELRDEEPSKPLAAVPYNDASVQSDWESGTTLDQLASPPSAPSVLPTLPALSISSVHAESIEPQSEPDSSPSPPSLKLSSILSEQTEPVAEQVELPVLTMPPPISEDIEPVSQPEPPQPEPPRLSAILSQNIEPVSEPEPSLPEPPTLSVPMVLSQEIEPAPLSPVALSFSAVTSEQVEPVADPATAPPSPIALSCPPIRCEEVEPVELPAPIIDERTESDVGVPSSVSLSFSPIASEHVEPQSEEPIPPVKLSFAPINVQEVEPLQEAETEAPPLALASIQTLDVAPREAPAPPLALASIQTLDVAPREAPAPPLSVSSAQSWSIEPLDTPPAVPPALSLSGIETQSVEPLLADNVGVAPVLGVSGIQSWHTEPAEPRSPKRNAFIIPRDVEGAVNGAQSPPRTPPADAAPGPKKVVATTDQGAQTALTSQAIEEMLRVQTEPSGPADLERRNSLGSMGTPSTVRIHRPRQVSVDGSMRAKGKMADAGADGLESSVPRRPGSSASAMTSLGEVPPLPPNHKEVIEAARSGSSQGGPGTIGLMGPPLVPASALRAQNQSLRPRTPTGARRPTSPVSHASGRGTPTPRAAGRPGAPFGTADVHEVQSLSKATLRSRKSSISSFTSEVDTRFNLHQGGGFESQGFGPNTDPRMIQAITQTMIGEYLWKYTRKAGRGEMSEKRHRRYFWVHPYTRTLYWSDRDPSTAGRSELRAKSVQIEAVRVVADDNPMPPGLHQKSLVIVSPGRSVKFTCTTGQRHETWFNALSYLLLRTASEGQTDAEEMAGNITREDVEEFNPSFGRRQANGNRTAPSPSLSSYNSRTVRDSPPMDISMSIPTLTPTRSKASHNRASFGTLSRISGYLKDNKLSGTFGSIRSRSAQGHYSSQGVYEASEVPDSAEDLRRMIERQDREADRIENVRACCDGKHDVGTLTNSAKRGRHSVAGFRSPTPGPSTSPTPVGTVRSRA
ncbi:uncharacterized protein THITE_2111495 [Thermothielavioides terrestris NRRL 8126]|uniref:PH domain-containing protein n=1 Tax=Thermothielavioides terrestris (strain ATCC 38088 / NRRL 8126) TaxID=578455 RepID=G2R2P7_THETT|nr:uncharacterized protein THITE_2111495 [Thermothielavioides terrestris NRRL 8126]AEO65008.1 hypothetical protein THITE_2111495 [Thermothielavioides terrestris NRRL 8126]